MQTIFENIKEYIPNTTLRAINKQYHTDYCDQAAHIYNDDMNIQGDNLLFLKDDKSSYNHIFYYKDEEDYTVAIIKQETNYITYHMTKEDEYYKLSIKPIKVEINEPIVDIDIMSKYQIMKSRGCEDVVKDFSKKNTIRFLLKTFTDFFNPDMMSDIVYLYIYLHSNLILLNYTVPKPFKIFKMTKLPKQEVLDQIYDMYNLLYVHINLL